MFNEMGLLGDMDRRKCVNSVEMFVLVENTCIAYVPKDPIVCLLQLHSGLLIVIKEQIETRMCDSRQ